MLISVAIEDSVEQMEVTEESVLTFAKGIVGFEELTGFVLFQIEPQLYLLQAAGDPHVGFVVMDPYLLDDGYRVPEREEYALLELEDEDQRSVLCVVSPAVDGRPSTVNLRAPIIVNATKRLGTQIILQNDRYPVRFPIAVSPDGGIRAEVKAGTVFPGSGGRRC